MKILIIGLGSMGRRRIRLLQKISGSYLLMGVDTQKERCETTSREFHIEVSSNLDAAFEQFQPDAVVISTSPLSHKELINKCLLHNCHVFTELNLVKDGYEENIALAREKQKVLFLSSTFLYREEIQYIEKATNPFKGRLNYTYHVGQYLPDWHPWESIQNYFVADKRTNGCRELFAIELPWLSKVFGEIESVMVRKGKNTSLPIDYCDNYQLLLTHKGGNKGSLAVDVVSRKAVRNLEIYGEELYLTWNGQPTGLKRYDYNNKQEEVIDVYQEIDKQEGYASFVIENAYQNELVAYLKEISGEKGSRYSFEDDLRILEWIDKIEGEVEH